MRLLARSHPPDDQTRLEQISLNRRAEMGAEDEVERGHLGSTAKNL